jgi:outer membrane murein-binding lipoprotein Lpp
VKRTLIFMAIGLLLSGCNENSKIEIAVKELKQSQEKIIKLETALNDLKEAINKDREAYKWDKFISKVDQIAYLTPGAEGYSTVRFDLGVLTVNLFDIKPYANGTKVTLEFGNTLSATVNGLKATIDWGKVDEKGSPINEQAKSKEITLNEPLLPGAWTKSSVVLDGVPASEFGFIRIKDISHSGVRLLKK